MCLLRREGLSKAFPHTSQGNSVLSRGFLTTAGTLGSVLRFSMSPAEEAAELAELSPETDLCSSVSLAGVTSTLERSDMDKSRGESEM